MTSRMVQRILQALVALRARLRPLDGSNWRATGFAVLLLIVLPTLVYKALSARFGFTGPWFDLDFVLAYVLMLLGARIGSIWLIRLGFLAIIASFSVQVLVGIGVIYLVDPVLVADYLAFASYWPWGTMLKWAVLGLGAMFLVYLLVRPVRLDRARIWPVLLVTLVVVGAEKLGSSNERRNALSINVATSGALSLFHLGEAWINYQGFRAEPVDFPAMPQRVLGLPEAQRPARILSLSVEALGLFKDPAADAVVFAPLERAVGQVYTVEMGRHPFKGATLSGELRELCGLRTLGTPGKESIARIGANCLPSQLRKQGYQTIGLHGNTGYFYNRVQIYPGIGFDETMFGDDFHRRNPNMTVCQDNTFVGTCDATVVQAALEFLSARHKAMAHVMTLQSHFPLGVSSLGDDRCGAIAGMTDPDLCLYANTMSNLLARLGKQIAEAPMLPDVVYIYGDHAPPFAMVDKREAFERGQVPFIVLTRKSGPAVR